MRTKLTFKKIIQSSDVNSFLNQSATLAGINLAAEQKLHMEKIGILSRIPYLMPTRTALCLFTCLESAYSI